MNTRKAVLRVGGICLRAAVFILICLGLVSLGKTTYRYTHAVFSEEAYEEEPGRTVQIKIPEDVSAKRLAEVMEENGLVEDAGVLKVQMKMADFQDTVKAGTYELNTSMTPREMFKILSTTNGDEK